MNVTARSYLTAGVAVVGAGAVALSPVQPLPGDLTLAPHAAISEMAVGLAAAVTPLNPLQTIVDVIVASGSNLGILIDDWANGLYVDGTIPSPDNTGIRPGVLPNNGAVNGNLGWRTGGYETGYLAALPIVEQVVRNLLTYLGELPDIGGIAQQIVANIGNAFRAPFEPGVNEPGKLDGAIGGSIGALENFNQNVNGIPYVSVPLLGEMSQRDIGALLPVLAGPAYAALAPIISVLSTPISGVLVGAIGPIVAPILAVVDSVSNAVALLQESNFIGAVTELINIPANAVGAFLNGGPTLDLTGLVSLLGVTLPDSITSIGLKMGGLLSPGGVALDALAAVADAGGLTIDVAGLPVGPVGALVSLTNYVAKSIVVTPPPTAASAASGVTDVAPVDDAPVEAAKVAAEAPAGVAEVAEVAATQAVSEVTETAGATDSDKPSPKRERRGAAARGADSAGASASTDGGDAKPSRAARRAG